MRATTMKKAILHTQLLLGSMVAVVLLLSATAHAAAPGITGPTFNLTAQPAYLTQPDGQMIYSWGYGCASAPAGFKPTMPNQACSSMQVPGPTLIVTAPASGTLTVTINPPFGDCANVAMARSIWFGSRRSIGLTSMPTDGATA